LNYTGVVFIVYKMDWTSFPNSCVLALFIKVKWEDYDFVFLFYLKLRDYSLPNYNYHQYFKKNITKKSIDSISKVKECGDLYVYQIIFNESINYPYNIKLTSHNV
jgi:hypothetical protein